MMDTLPELAPSLARIVAPARVDEFLARYWKKAVFLGPGSAARLAPLLAAMGSSEIATLLAHSQQFVAMGAGRSLSAAEALAAYETRGATLYFRMRDDFPLCHWTRALAGDLGELPIGVTSFFAVRNRGGTRPHFDWNENFTIQICGTKEWRVAPAPKDFVVHPVTNWAIGDLPPLYAHSSRRPEAMPAEAEVFRLAPGSVLYVPRGHLHQVTSVDDTDSLSLNLSFPPTPWAVILTTLLGARLLEDPEFRDAVMGAFGSGWGRGATLERLPALMEEFSRNAAAVGDDLRALLDDPEKIPEYLAKRGYPRL